MSDAEGSSELSAAANSSWMEPALFDAHPHPPSAQSLHTHPARVCHNAFAALWCFCFLAGKVSSDKPGLRSGFSCPDTHTAGLELPGRAGPGAGTARESPLEPLREEEEEALKMPLP